MTPPPIMLTSFCGVLVSGRTGIVHLALLYSPSSTRTGQDTKFRISRLARCAGGERMMVRGRGSKRRSGKEKQKGKRKIHIRVNKCVQKELGRNKIREKRKLILQAWQESLEK